MERELVMSGIGGQGIQLAATVVARAALAEGREVQVFGSYGGMMRGGNTESTLVVADGPIEAPPTVTGAWSAILAHPQYSAAALARLGAGAIVVLNASVWDGTGAVPESCRAIEVAATAMATAVGHPVAASMVLVGAYAAATGLIGLDALCDAVGAALPPYRAQHAALSVAALRAGYGALPGRLVDAWPVAA